MFIVMCRWKQDEYKCITLFVTLLHRSVVIVYFGNGEIDVVNSVLNAFSTLTMSLTPFDNQTTFHYFFNQYGTFYLVNSNSGNKVRRASSRTPPY